MGLVRPAGAQSLPFEPATPSLLFVQTAAAGGTIRAVPGEANTFALTLKQVGPTIVFADRPQRFFRTQSSADFVANDFPAFGSVFPYAVLEVRTGAQTLSARVTLVSAITKTGDPSEIAYLVKPVPEQFPSDYQGGVVALSFLPAAFDFATLFIGDQSSDLTLGAPEPGGLLVEIAPRQMSVNYYGHLLIRGYFEKTTIIIQSFVRRR